MSTTHFNIREHIIPVPRVGGRERGVDSTLLLAIKQYTPKAPHSSNGITLIAAPANAQPKEVYEPLWDRIFEVATRKGIAIGHIWMADIAHQGESGIRNEGKTFDKDISPTEHSRDLLTMMNHFKDDMRSPIIGFGHSMGGIHIVHLAITHPRLFTGIILVDPMLRESLSVELNLKIVKATAARRDRWPSREEAVKYLRRSRVYGAWDAEAFDKFAEHGLRQASTDDGESQDDRGAVTLTTPVHQEIMVMVRPGAADTNGHLNAALVRSAPRIAFQMLRHVQPRMLFVTGGKSNIWPHAAETISSAGIEINGSGSRVVLIVLEEAGHYPPMENPQKTAEVIVQWLDVERNESAKAWKL